jgi:uncharacterized membrane protein YfcA
MISIPVLVVLAVVTSGLGALGGIGGAVLLVPVLVLGGMEPELAAPLGMLSVAAGALAAGATQLNEGLVHHRLGITIEIGATIGVVVGALVSQALSADVLSRILALTAIAAAFAGGRRTGMRNLPHDAFAAERAGEWPGTLGGAYRLGDEVVPYAAKRVPLGTVLMSAAGVVAGISGTSGGFLKTPILSEVMHVPVKVAAATTTFTISISAAVALLVYAGHGSVDAQSGAAIVLGALLGGRLGAVLQARLSPHLVRRVLSVVLVAVGIVLLVVG